MCLSRQPLRHGPARWYGLIALAGGSFCLSPVRTAASLPYRCSIPKTQINRALSSEAQNSSRISAATTRIFVMGIFPTPARLTGLQLTATKSPALRGLLVPDRHAWNVRQRRDRGRDRGTGRKAGCEALIRYLQSNYQSQRVCSAVSDDGSSPISSSISRRHSRESQGRSTP